jgi:branched-chain amino acid transport system permease protein
MRSISLGFRAVTFAAAVALLAVVPSFVSDYRASQFALVGIYFIAILGLNIVTGWTGQISLGHGAFMAIGGYTTAILIADHGWKDVATIPVAALVAGAVGFAFGLPALRLSGLYLALATFAIAVAAPSVIKKFEGLTGGSGGINLFEAPGLTGALFNVVHIPGWLPGDSVLTFNDWMYYLTWACATALFACAWALSASRFGRAFHALHESEVAATSAGVNLAAYKTFAFAISAAFAGVAGSLLAISVAFVNPDTFPILLSIELLVGLALGGLGSSWALAAGAAFIVYVRSIDELADVGSLPERLQLFAKEPGAPSIVYGGILIVLMFLIPTGVGGLGRRLLGPLTTRLYSRS